MYTWKELAEEFRQLRQPLSHSYISVQWGDAGTHLHLSGATTSSTRSEFNTLSELAGMKINSLPDHLFENNEEISSESDPVTRWYMTLWRLGRSYKYHSSSWGAGGNDPVEKIHLGTIRNPIQDSVNLCMRFSEYDKQETKDTDNKSVPMFITSGWGWSALLVILSIIGLLLYYEEIRRWVLSFIP